MSRFACNLTLGLALLLSAPALVARDPRPPTEYLDEQTGATVTIANKPLVFARERSERAANLRDYVNLLAASVNRGGKTEYVLIAYVWSTLDARYSPTGSADTVTLRADDRAIALNANGKRPSDLGIEQHVNTPPGKELKTLVFPVDLPTLRFISAARSLTLELVADESTFGYDLWEDQRAALGKFVQFLNGQR